MSAPLMHKKNRRLRDHLMCLKVAGLVSGKAKNSDSKLVIQNPSLPTEATHTA